MSVPKNSGLLNDDEEGEESYETAESMDPELYRAVTQGDILEFVRAMEKGALDRYHSPQACCIQLGPQKNTVLHIATKFRHHEIVKLVCKDLPFFATEKNSKGDTALHIAARAGDPLLVRLLVDSNYKEGGILGEQNVEGNTALHEALYYHHEEVAWILIDKNRNMSYSINKEGKSLLYLAAKAGFVHIVRVLMENPVGIYSIDPKVRMKSAVYAAIHWRNIDVLRILWEKDQSSFQLRCEGGWNPLHHAASLGYLKGVHFLLNKFCDFIYQRDKLGLFPIHLASREGHINVIQLMLRYRPDSRDLLTLKGYNILHVAAKRGKTTAISCMLKMPELQQLVNEKEEDGNTPLHIATYCGHPKIVSTLVEDKRVNLEMKNNLGMTALDIAEECMETMASFSKRLTWMALRVAGAPRGKVKRKKSKRGEQSKVENYRDKVNVVLSMATLVATVTFTAGFTVPGGYNNSTPDQGMATMLETWLFQLFVICDTIAMYSSILASVFLIWAQIGNLNSIHVVMKLALSVLGFALLMMSMAFMASVYLVVSKLGWLAHLVLFTGSIFMTALSGLYIPLCFLGFSMNYIFRKFSYYPFRAMLYTLGTYFGDDREE